MAEQKSIPGRFVLSQNAIGVTSIVDTARKDSGERGAVAIFFQDKQYPARAELYAKVCAAALNQEAARRARKE